MEDTVTNKSVKAKVLIYIVLALIFVLDLNTPLGVAVGYFYVPALCFLAIYFNVKQLFYTTLFLIALIILGGVIAYGPDTAINTEVWVINRAASAIALVAALLFLKFAKTKINRLANEKSIVKSMVESFGIELISVDLSELSVRVLGSAEGLTFFKTEKSVSLERYCESLGERNKKSFLRRLRKIETTDTYFDFESPILETSLNENWYRIQGHQTAPHQYTCIVQNISLSGSSYNYDKNLYAVLDTLPCFTWVAAPGGELLFANQKFLEQTGFSFEAFKKNWKNSLSHEELQGFRKEWVSANKEKRRGSTRVDFRNQDGSHSQVIIEFFPVLDQNGDIAKWFGSGVDISKVVDLEKKNRVVSEVADATTDSALVISYSAKSQHYKADYVNKSFESATNFTINELAETNILEWLNGTLMRQRTSLKETSLSKPTDINGHYTATFGNNTRNVDVITLPLDAKDERFVIIIKDRTAEQRLEKVLERDARLDSIGQVAGGIAHDFNNLLSVISGNLEMTKLEKLTEEAIQYVNNATVAARQGARLASSLLLFASGTEDGADEVSNVSDVIQTNRDVYSSIVADFGQIDIQCGKHLCAHIPQSQLESIILNLITNTRDPLVNVANGQVAITVDSAILSKSKAQLLGCEHGEYVKICVSDNGRGMSEKQLANIFTPFYSSKSKLHGTGLGLSMVYAYVRQSGGVIDVESSPGKGTTFKLFFKRAEGLQNRELQERFSETASQVDVYTGKVAVLVEDKIRVAEVARRHLQDFGFDVTYFPSADHALDTIADGVKPDLLFTDISMPGSTDGFELAEMFEEKFGHVPTIYVSGYFMSSKGVAHSVRLQKPYTKDALADALHKVMV